MEYRNLGSTGIKISRLGFGCMRLPSIAKKCDVPASVKLLREAYEKGINYFDTGDAYMDHTSESTVAQAIKPFRNKVYLSTKTRSRDFDEFQKHFEGRLKIFGTVDVYHFWGTDLKGFEKMHSDDKIFNFMYKAKKEGKIRAIAASFHDENQPENAKKVIDYGVLDSIMFSYNILNYQKHEKWIEYAHKKGVGTIAMNPVGGGLLSELTPELKAKHPDMEQKSVEIALKYLLNNPNLDMLLSGMGSSQMLDFNVKTVSSDYSLQPKDYELIAALREEKKDALKLFCTGCKYCSKCPQQIEIHKIFKLYNQSIIYNSFEACKKEYKKIKYNFNYCIACGACEAECPQSLKIIENLEKIDKIFE